MGATTVLATAPAHAPATASLTAVLCLVLDATVDAVDNVAESGELVQLLDPCGGAGVAGDGGGADVGWESMVGFGLMGFLKVARKNNNYRMRRT